MTSQQIHDAMKKKTPVSYDGKRYARILEYVSWYDGGVHQLSAVLLAEQGNYTVRVPAGKVEECKSDGQQD